MGSSDDDEGLSEKQWRPRASSPSDQTRWWPNGLIPSPRATRLLLRREELANAVKEARLARLDWEGGAAGVPNVEVDADAGVDVDEMQQQRQQQDNWQYFRWKRTERHVKLQRKNHNAEREEEKKRIKKYKERREAIKEHNQRIYDNPAEEQHEWEAERGKTCSERGDYRRLVQQLGEFLFNPTVTPFPKMETRYGYRGCYRGSCVRAEGWGICRHGLESCLEGSGWYSSNWVRREREEIWKLRNFAGDRPEMVNARVRVGEMSKLMRVLLEGR